MLNALFLLPTRNIGDEQKVNLEEIRTENLVNYIKIPAISLFKFFKYILILIPVVLINSLQYFL